MTKQLNVKIDVELEKFFRDRVGQVKGARKGAIGEALQEALELWLEKMEANKKVKETTDDVIQ